MALKWYESLYMKELDGRVSEKQYYMADRLPFLIRPFETTYLYPLSDKENKEPVTAYRIETHDGEFDLIADGHLEEPGIGDTIRAEIRFLPNQEYRMHGNHEDYGRFLPKIRKMEKTTR